MIIQCPTCKSRREINKINGDKVLCKDCGVSFLAENNRITNDPFARIWVTKGEKKIPVSWRVLKHRARTGKLTEKHEISSDSIIWLKAGDYPELLHLIQQYFGARTVPTAIISPNKDKKPISKSSSPENCIPKTSEKGQYHKEKKAWKTSVILVMFAIVSAGLFFFPLSKRVRNIDMESQEMKLNNLSLKGELSSAKIKIEDRKSVV